MDFAAYTKKHVTTAHQQGVATAAFNAVAEAALTAAKPIADRLATPIWTTDWDVCIVLDGCRADTYQDVTGRHGSAWSVGSRSPEWMSKTFHPNYAHNLEQTGYVTANPFSAKTGTEAPSLNPDTFPLTNFAYLDEVWADQWNHTGIPTVSPDVLTDRAMWAWSNRQMLGIDRVIVHYMQPHVPFRSQPTWTSGWELDGFGTGGGRGKNDWQKVRDGDINRAEFIDAYRDNLKWVLTEVDRWRRELDGYVLVTADHGNAAGEFGEWGHPPRSANPAIRKVPWDTHVVRGHGINVEDVPGSPPVHGADERGVEERLKALGYVG